MFKREETPAQILARTGTYVAAQHKKPVAKKLKWFW